MYKMRRTKLILNHFYNAGDLKQGIEMLQRYHVPILEVYLSKPVKGIEEKLQIKQLRQGHAAIKFGFIGAMGLSTLIYYLAEQGWPLISSKSTSAFLVTLIIMALTFFLATALLPLPVPKVINLTRADGQLFLIIVDAQHTTDHDELRHLFQYAEAVEMSSLIKNIITT